MKHHNVITSSLVAVRGRIAAIGRAALGFPVATRTRVSIGDFTPVMWGGRRMTPEEVRSTLQAAIGGNLQEQWALFDMMEDTWPRLTKNLSEVRRAASRVTYSVQPYAERGEKPTDSAKERADLVECALRNWRPKPGTLELGLEDALFNSLDALGKGLSVLEVSWQRNEDGLLPRCAHFLHPRSYGWNSAGTELGLVNGLETSGLDYSARRATWQEFPPGQFWVGVWHARSGPPGQTALLRALAPYWCGITFGWEWLLNNAQIFGVPFRWATYDPNQPQNLTTISTMLANMGSAGWAAFPTGTTMEFKEAVTRAADNPQVFVQQLADKYCDQLILGQEASSESKPAGLGNGASDLHGSVRDNRLQDAAQWCADLLNYQLVGPLLQWNWGDQGEPPTIVPDTAGESDPGAKAERDKTLVEMGMQIPVKYLYERHAIPAPEGDEETIGGPGAGGGPNNPQSTTGLTEESAAPGSPSDAGNSPESGAGASKRGDSRPGKPSGGTQVAARSSKRAGVDSPRFAAARGKASADDQRTLLPGEYETPEATQQALAAARARDFAPLRKAAAPMLTAIEAGNLPVIGEMEAFIARLDELAPVMAGASELADTLEAALAEAAIAGAAGVYAKAKPVAPVSTQ